MACSMTAKIPPLKEGEKYPEVPKLNVKEEKYHVFIAHSRKQSDFVGLFRERLHKVFNIICCDVDEDFRPGVSVLTNIVYCIQKTRKVVLLVSKDFIESEWTDVEIAEATVRKTTIIPILWYDVSDSTDNLPTDIRRLNYLKLTEEHFWKKLIIAIADETICNTVSVGDVADGLAWSYYCGFLKFVLPGLIKRTKLRDQFVFPKEARKTYEDIKDLVMLPKMMIIMPKSGFCPMNLTDDDENVQFVCHIPHKSSRAGNIDRDYKSSIYSVKSPPDNKEVLIIAEFATPLMSMYEMVLDKLANFSEQGRLQQKLKFEEKVQEILYTDKDCQGSFCFLQLEDPRDKDNSMKPMGWSLAKEMSVRAFSELDNMDKQEMARQERDGILEEEDRQITVYYR